MDKHLKKSQVKQIKKESNVADLSSNSDTINIDVIALNNKAVKLLQESQQDNYNLKRKDTLLREALTNLNMAIKRDSNYYNAYLNKYAVYCEMRQYKKAITTLEELLTREEYPDAIFFIGLMYEKQGNQKLANQKYKDAYDAYLEQMRTPFSTAKDEMKMYHVLLFLEGKEKVLERINIKLKDNPENTNLLAYKRLVEQFNREEFISNL